LEKAELHLELHVGGFVGRQIDVVVAEAYSEDHHVWQPLLSADWENGASSDGTLTPLPPSPLLSQVDQGLFVDQPGDDRLGEGRADAHGDALAE
jgi:hypothetical protein